MYVKMYFKCEFFNRNKVMSLFCSCFCLVTTPSCRLPWLLTTATMVQPVVLVVQPVVLVVRPVVLIVVHVVVVLVLVLVWMPLLGK
jgi:hypothetical protein